ncbi:hypothetical protein Tco_0902099 [Tanacetum coccineum]
MVPITLAYPIGGFLESVQLTSKRTMLRIFVVDLAKANPILLYVGYSLIGWFTWFEGKTWGCVVWFAIVGLRTVIRPFHVEHKLPTEAVRVILSSNAAAICWNSKLDDEESRRRLEEPEEHQDAFY